MKKRSGIILAAALLALVIGQGAAMAQDAPVSYSIQTITIKGMPTYDMEVSPDGQTAAVFIGRTAQSVLGMPIAEYEVDPLALPIYLIDLTTGETKKPLIGATDYASDVAFTPDGERLVSYHRNGEMIVWDLAAQQPIQRFNAIMGVAYLKVLPDGRHMVAHMADSMVHQFLVWDLETGYVTAVWRTLYKSFGEIKLSRPPVNMNYTYTSFDVSPDGAWMATATASGEVALWDTATLKQTILQAATEETAGRFTVRQVRFSADGMTLVYYDATSEQTHFWDVASQTETRTLPQGDLYLALSPQGDLLAYGNRSELWLTPVDQPERATQVTADTSDAVRMAFPVLVFTPDGRLVVGGSGAGEDYLDGVITIVTPEM